MAYFCLTFLEWMANEEIGRHNNQKIKGRDAATEYFQVSKKVLDRIGNLSTKRGGPSEARKREGVKQDLTAAERRFLRKAVEIMIRRTAEKAHAPGKNLVTISLCDLPPCG